MSMQNFATLKINLTRSNSIKKDVAIKKILDVESARDELSNMIKWRASDKTIDEQRSKVDKLSNDAYMFATEALRTKAA